MYSVWLSVLLYWLIQQGVDATLTPNGPTVSVDCGGQRTFTCSVTGASAGWTFIGLNGLTASGSAGRTVATSNSRVTTTDSSGVVKTSTITITEFTTADDGGTVQCFDQASTMVQGMTAVSVVSTTLASATAVMANVDQCSATLTWSEPTDFSGTTAGCTPSSPQCSSCTSSGCAIGGLNPNTSYTFSVNRSRSGCDDSTAQSNPVTTAGMPSCPTSVRVNSRSSDFSSATITWEQPVNSPPVTSYNVTCNSSCTVRPCTTSGSSTCRVVSVTHCKDYSVTILPMNSCGSNNECPESVVTVTSQGVCPTPTVPVINTTTSTGLIVGVSVGGVVVVVVVGVSSYGITILIMGFTCYSSLGFLALLKCLCCPCCKGKARKSSSKQRIDSASPVTPPTQPPAQPPADEYADPQAIRDRKERGKEDKDKIQYAAIDFSAGAGSGAGEVKIHQKEEPVIYTTVQHV